MPEKETTALVGDVEMSTVPVLKVFAPTELVSVNRAPVALTMQAVTAMAEMSPAVINLRELADPAEEVMANAFVTIRFIFIIFAISLC
jgi:hypothetical protein